MPQLPALTQENNLISLALTVFVVLFILSEELKQELGYSTKVEIRYL